MSSLKTKDKKKNATDILIEPLKQQQNTFFNFFSPVQQTTSGIGHRVKYFFRVGNQYAGCEKQQQQYKKNVEKRLNKGRQTRDTIHMTIRGIYTVRSTDMFDLSSCATTDICALLATLARACLTAASNSPTSSIKCLFSRMNIMRSTLLASILLRRSPMRKASAEKFRSASGQLVASILWYNRAINARYGISAGDVIVLVVGHTLLVPR